MSLVRLDDKRALNAKLVAAGLEARGLDEAAICWCSLQETDGFITAHEVATLAVAHGCKRWHRLVDRLVEVGRWESTDVGRWHIADLSTDRTTPGGKRLRFEVLRRDGFTCRYCGRSAPDVELQVDHVWPKLLGGSDNPTNLVTACVDCNVGKSATPLNAAVVADVESADVDVAEMGPD